MAVYLNRSDYWIEFVFEKEISAQYYVNWMKNYWIYTLHISTLYVIAIFLCQCVMKNRQPFCLRGPLIVWNVTLAALSTWLFVRFTTDFVDSLFYHGFYESICIRRDYDDRVYYATAFWFVMLKVPEMLDTLFIVLRKRKLIFLHWYHHVTVVIYTFYAGTQASSTGRWFTWTNSLIHSLMYSYYALKAMNIRLPVFVPITLTSLQILQMFIGLFVNYFSYTLKSSGAECHISTEHMAANTVLYGSYFVLFLNFFYHAYISGSKSKQKTG